MLKKLLLTVVASGASLAPLSASSHFSFGLSVMQCVPLCPPPCYTTYCVPTYVPCEPSIRWMNCSPYTTEIGLNDGSVYQVAPWDRGNLRGWHRHQRIAICDSCQCGEVRLVNLSNGRSVRACCIN